MFVPPKRGKQGEANERRSVMYIGIGTVLLIILIVLIVLYIL
jgi:Tfp pilus assembly protein PilN